MSKKHELQPLQELLDSVLSRLDVLETKVGVSPSSKSKAAAAPPPAVSPVPNTPPPPAGDASPAVKAYDAFLETSVTPLVDACNALGGMQNMGQLLRDAWTSIRTIIVITSKAKQPADVLKELQPHLKDTQAALAEIRKLRLDRNYDDHVKALLESSAALSWILVRPPPQTPAAFVKEASSSTEFWSNRIRKREKGVERQIAFCNALQQVLLDLVEYIAQNAKTGLEWNPRGVSLAEAAIVVASPCPAETGLLEVPHSPRPYVAKVSGGSGGMSNLVAELASKRTADGSSAATGLKHVTRDQQTWRKEFKGEKKATVPVVVETNKEEKSSKKKLTGLPICEYQERGHKWVVEHQASAQLVVEVTDPKQQVYMFNCNRVTLQVKGGKVKSVILDSCQHCQVVFETVISACEVVHCKKIELQTTGVCPSFSIDQTEGCLVYLSKESVATTNFVTSQSTEMNVSFPDGDEQKELPIPEQFVHKLVNGAVTSEVSDVYH